MAPASIAPTAAPSRSWRENRNPSTYGFQLSDTAALADTDTRCWMKCGSYAAGANRPDSVVDVDVPMSPDVGTRQQRDCVVGVAGSESLFGACGRQIDGGQHREHGRAAGASPQPQLRAELDVPQTGHAAGRVGLRQGAVGAESDLEPLGHARSE